MRCVSGSKYTRAVLLPVVQSARSYSEVLRKLGLRPSGGNHRYISARIRAEHIDVSHFRYQSIRARVSTLTAESLVPLVASSKSVAQVAKAIGLPAEGRAHRYLVAHMAKLRVDTRHFRGAAWARGETSATHRSVAAIARTRTIPDDAVFTENSAYLSSEGLVRRLRARGWTYACQECGITDWRGAVLALHLDQVNGVHNDHRLSNLRFLCPNCHSQTSTYCRKKKPGR